MVSASETSQDLTCQASRTGQVESVQVEAAGSTATAFWKVFLDELNDLKIRRKDVIREETDWNPGRGVVPNADPVEIELALRRQAFDHSLFGLALSGGGIRSATFCLGVLQALAQTGLLRRVDYLSTVSGGGYIGAWLAAWIKREGDVENVEKQLHPNHHIQASAKRGGSATSSSASRPSCTSQANTTRGHGTTNPVLDDEPEAVCHLRAYSKYLAPRPGLLSPDGWTLIAIYLRNFLLNQLVLCSALLTLLFSVFLIVVLFAAVPVDAQDNGGWQRLERGDPDQWTHLTTAPGWPLALVGVSSFLALLIACVTINRGLLEVRLVQRGEKPGVQMSPGLVHGTILFPLLVTAVGISFLALYLNIPKTDSDGLRPALCVIAAYVFMHGVFYTRRLVQAIRHLWHGEWKKAGDDFWWFVSALLAPGVAGLLTYLAVRQLRVEAPDRMFGAPLLVTFGPPLVLSGFVLIGFLQVGLVGRLLEEDQREWWSSLAGRLMIYAAGWAALFGAAVYGPYLVLLGLEHFPSEYFRSLGGGLVGGWVAAVAVGLRAASNRATGTPADARTRLDRLRDLLARLAPGLFLIGMFIIGAWFTQRLGRALYEFVAGSAAPCPFNRAESYLAFLTLSVPQTPSHDNVVWEAMILVLTLAVAVAGSLALGFGRIVDINIFSLNALYANRLIRCYLGASRPKVVSQSDQQRRRRDRPAGAPMNSKGPVRNPNLITGFDPLDDLRLCELAYEPLARGEIAGAKERYGGPTLIINTALNLVRGRELAWQERKAESFVLTARYCGSDATNYRPTKEFAEGIRLGAAMSISGAAVSPNMGYHSSPGVTALLTAFNARLGAWVGNPYHEYPWKDRGPKLGLLYLLYEMIGRTDNSSSYLYLSDGGHFDNTGVYELVRRRCRFIIVCDAGADGDFGLEDLGNLIRKVRIDFGIRIDIDVSNLKRRPDRHALAHVAVGKIRYGDVDRENAPRETCEPAEVDADPHFHANSGDGVLVYIKPTLTGDEPSDVLNYAGEHRSFPHESTLNQFFTESQFESYRALGYHSVNKTLGRVVKELSNEKPQFTNIDFIEQVCGKLCSPPPDFTPGFLAANREFMALHKALREEAALARLSSEIYYDLPRPADAHVAPDPATIRSERHMVAEMLTVLENACFGLQLDRYLHHPVHDCWCRVCKRWLGSPIFMRHYEVLSCEFSGELRLFVRQMLAELASEQNAALRNGQTGSGGNAHDRE
jgi:hypothetical protein